MQIVDPLFWPLLAGLTGLVVGSFLSTLVLRWPAGETLAGRSRCDHCRQQLGVADLWPLLSWALARGRCRHCGAPINSRHPLTEAAAALIAVLAVIAMPGPAGFAGALFGWILLALLMLDLDHYWLPDRLTLPLLVLGLWLGVGSLPLRLAGAALGGGLLWVVGFLYRQWRGREGVGLGDVKLLAALGAWLGPWALGPLLLLAAVLGLLLGLFGATKNEGHGTRIIPFGACLCVAAFPIWLFLVSQAAGF